MKLLDAFKSKKPDRDPKDNPAGAVVIVQSGIAKPSIDFSHAMAAERVLEHPITFRCVNRIAEAVSSVKWYAATKGNKRAAVGPVAKLNEVLQSPNDMMTGGDLRYWIAMVYAIHGRAPVKIGQSTLGYANGIYPLQPHHFKAVTNKRGGIEGYEYGTGDKAEKLKTRAQAEEDKRHPGYAAQIVRPNLSASWTSGRPNSALNAIHVPAEITKQLMMRAHETASGHPNARYIISSEKALTQAQVDEIRLHVEESAPGKVQSGSILMVDGVPLKIDKLDNDLGDIHSKMPLDDMSRQIAGVFGVPVPLLGLGGADAAKYASNYQEARRSFYEDTIIPGYLRPIAEGLTDMICPEDYEIKFDFDTIEALVDSRVKKAADLESVTFLTEDEKRELCGYGPKAQESQ